MADDNRPIRRRIPLFNFDKAKLTAMEQRIGEVKKTLEDSARVLGDFGRQLTIVGGVGVAVFGAASKAAIDWETAWTGVLKTVNGTESELEHLQSRLREMARDEIPLSHGELASIAEQAGQLNIQTSNIDAFTDTIAKLAATTDLTVDSAQSLAQFGNIVRMDQQDIDRLGAVIAHLGNNTATTESKIVDMGLRIAGIGNQVGLTEAQILSWAASLASVGLESEAGGTAISRVFAEMDAAVQGQTEELGIFAQVARMSVDEFAALFSRDASAATKAFIGGLAELQATGGNVHTVLEAVGFQNVRIRDTLLRGAGAVEVLDDALILGSQAWEENIALTREAELRFGTTGSQITLLKNKVVDAGITIGNIFLPTIHDVINAITPLIARIDQWAEQHPTLVQWVAALSLGVFALGGILLGVAGIMKLVAIILPVVQLGIAGLTGAIALLNPALATTNAGLMRLPIVAKAAALWSGIVSFATAAWTAAQWGLNIALLANPIGLIIALVVGLIAVATAILIKTGEWRQAWEALKEIGLDLWESLSSAFSVVGSAVGELVRAIAPLIPGLDDAAGSGNVLGQILKFLVQILGFVVSYGFLPLILFLNILGGAIKVVTRVLTGDFQGAWLAVLETGLNVVKSLVGVINAIPGVDIDTSALDQKIAQYKNEAFQVPAGTGSVGQLSPDQLGVGGVTPGAVVPGLQTPLPVAQYPAVPAGCALAGRLRGNTT